MHHGRTTIRLRDGRGDRRLLPRAGRSRRFDPFAPIWLFLVGYIQIYVVQAINYHAWAVSARGKDLVAAADWRALWALALVPLVYHLGPGRGIAPVLPRPPRRWSPRPGRADRPAAGPVGPVSAPGVVIRSGADEVASAERSLFRSFPFVMMVAAILLIVTGPEHAGTAAGLPGGRAGGRAALCDDLDVQRQAIALADRRAGDGLRLLHHAAEAALLARAVLDRLRGRARGGDRHQLEERPRPPALVRRVRRFLADFRSRQILESLKSRDGDGGERSHETEEYGGFLLMMDTVPDEVRLRLWGELPAGLLDVHPADHLADQAALRPDAWVNAWIAGSELERDEDFSRPGDRPAGGHPAQRRRRRDADRARRRSRSCSARPTNTSAATPTSRGCSSGGRSSITTPGSWSSTTIPLVWFYYNWGFTAFPLVVLVVVGQIASATVPAGGTSAPGVMIGVT